MPKINSINGKNYCHKMGLGFDSHAFGTTGTLVLGGVRFKGVPSLAGHSDGDALLHAVIDSILGGSSSGDIGELFPDSSHKWKDADSLRLLKLALAKIKKAGARPHHLDITIVADRPRLSSSKSKISETVARAMGLQPCQVNIKAKTQEGLNWFKSPGGIAVWAIATLTSSKK